MLVSVEDTLTILAMTGIILSIIILLYRQLMYITFDEEQARVSGLPISKLNYLFIILASVAVIVSMRLVGILLVSSLLVIPNVTALLFNKGFKKTALISVDINIFSSGRYLNFVCCKSGSCRNNSAYLNCSISDCSCSQALFKEQAYNQKIGGG
jgi:ABC-type Mn2+/Zn2+ transport system permease subunit